MKKLIYLFIVLISFCSCGESENNTEKILGGNHELRKFSVNTSTSTETRASYFVIAGSYSSKEITTTTVRFYFKNYKDEYEFKELPLTDVRIKTDSIIQKPYVRFYWNEKKKYGLDDINLSQCITKAVIYCNESDFQPSININEL